jgi:hypothetical protein
MTIINNIYHLLALTSIIISILFLFKRKINYVDNIITNIILMHCFFEIFIWLIPNQTNSGDIGALCYDLLFPLFITLLILLEKQKKIFIFFVPLLTIASQFWVKSTSQIYIAGEYKIILSFIASLTILLIVYKNLKKISFQIVLLIILSGIPLIDMFFNAAIFRFINFEMKAWEIFISFYIVYLSITNCIFIYYYGKQLLKNPYPTI